MELTFYDGIKEIFIATCETFKELQSEKSKFYERQNITPFYERWVGRKDGRTQIDYGSHYQFLYINVDVETLNSMEKLENTKPTNSLCSRKKLLRQIFNKFKK